MTIEGFNAKLVRPKERFHFECSRCGDCCRHVENAIMLESLDVFRLALLFRNSGAPIQTIEEILDQYTTPMPLNETGFPVFLLNTVGTEKKCIFLQDNRCSIQQAKPRTCRMYPFTAGPGEDGKDFIYYLCREKPHHFIGGQIIVKDWMWENFGTEDREYIKAEYQSAVERGKLLRRIREEDRKQVLFFVMIYRYYEFDLDSPFLPQYYRNTERLKQALRKLVRE